MIAVIDQPRVIEKILRHLGLWSGPSKVARPSPDSQRTWHYEPCDDAVPMADYQNVFTD